MTRSSVNNRVNKVNKRYPCCRRLAYSLGVVVLTLWPTLFASAGQDLGNIGIYSKWSKVEITLQGPSSNGLSNSNNPFKESIDVVFTGPDGQKFQVPGFYDGDGKGGMNGNVWKVRFSSNKTGQWSFTSTSNNSLLNGYKGTFSVSTPSGNAKGFAKWGRLEYVGGHYLKFADGPYWLKGGADEPEDFLGDEVLGDWNGKKAAVDYLATKGVNSLYIMPHTVDGDGDNVWPWASKKDSEHFDVAKLAKWDDLFDHIQSKEIVLHLVLEDDSGWTGFNRSLYYRQMVARFSHYNGLYWNISEEYNENYSSSQIKSFGQQLQNLDPFDHPITVHHADGLDTWDPFIGDNGFALTSFQPAGPSDKVAFRASVNNDVIKWRSDSKKAGWPLTISMDESGGFNSTDRSDARKTFWAVYMGGGMYEIFTLEVRQKGFQAFENIWNDMRHARNFVEGLPFWELTPGNSLLTNGKGNKYCFYKKGELYAIYLENGGTVSLDLSAEIGKFSVRWYDPQTGTYSNGATIAGGGVRSLGNSPFSEDSAAIVQWIAPQVDIEPPANPVGLKVQ